MRTSFYRTASRAALAVALLAPALLKSFAQMRQ